MLKQKTVGDFAEDFVVGIFEKHNIEMFYNKETTRKKLAQWDLKFLQNQKDVLVEVKFDMKSSYTGNLAIEFFNTKQGIPSGISSTKSDLWAIVLKKPMSCWITKTSVLRKYIEQNEPFRIVDGGDDNSAMKLYKKDKILIDIFHQINGLKTDDFLRIINELI